MYQSKRKNLIGLWSVIVVLIVAAFFYYSRGSHRLINPRLSDKSVTSDISKINGHEWVELGLSVKWATCNVGAEIPSAYGDYFAWGETDKKKTPLTGYFYTMEDYRFYSNVKSIFKLSKYNTRSEWGGVDSKIELELSDDVANKKWGSSWRMPTEKELQELVNECTWSWTTMNGVAGYKVSSKRTEYSDHYIFLPAAGIKEHQFINSEVDVNKLFSFEGEVGAYWSSSLDAAYPRSAWCFRFNSDEYEIKNLARQMGMSVRPVSP